MLIYFIHGVATRDASYANKLIKLIEEECKRKNLPIPYCHAGFWGNVLKGTEKLWRDIEQELQTQKQKNINFNPEQSFRYQNFRKEYLSQGNRMLIEFSNSEELGLKFDGQLRL